MKGSFRALLCLSAATAIGFGAAAPAGAETTADKARTVTTEDGWQLTIRKSAENIDRVAALSNAPTSREAFVSLSAGADIAGEGRVAVDSGSVQLGYQLGCQIDVSSGVTVGLSLAVGPNFSVSAAGPAVGVGAQVVPTVSANAKPGTVVNLPFGTKTLTGARGSITTEQVQIKVDGCLGSVSLRSYAIVSISTATADHSIAVYGDPVWL